MVLKSLYETWIHMDSAWALLGSRFALVLPPFCGRTLRRFEPGAALAISARYTVVQAVVLVSTVVQLVDDHHVWACLGFLHASLVWGVHSAWHTFRRGPIGCCPGPRQAFVCFCICVFCVCFSFLIRGA